MIQFVIDTNIIIKDPSIISRWSPNYQIIIPRFIFSELDKVTTRLGQIGNFWKTLEQAINSKFVTIYEDNVQISDEFYYRAKELRLSNIDLQLWELTRQLQKQNKDTFLVTNDRALRVFSGEHEVNTYDLYQFQSFVLTFKTTRIDELKENETIREYQNKKSLYGIITSVVIFILVILLKENFDIVYSTINIWGTLLLLLIIGVSFFLFRTNFRLEYGSIELIFGFYVTSRIFFDKEFDFTQIGIVEIVQIVSGVYVMVRGLSNIDDGIAGRTFEPNWRRLTRWRNKNTSR